jgi:hypothetical protein
VPDVLGNWTATSQTIPAKQLAMAGAVGQLARTYSNPQNGVTILVLLLCGLPGNISTHTPEACYPGAGYELDNAGAYIHRFGSPEQTAEFQTAVASRAGTIPSSLRIYWTWHGTGGWSAPANPRWVFAAEPVLSKLYIVRETGGVDLDPDQDPCAGFLSLLLPELDRMLSSPGQATFARSSSIAK